MLENLWTTSNYILLQAIPCQVGRSTHGKVELPCCPTCKLECCCHPIYPFRMLYEYINRTLYLDILKRWIYSKNEETLEEALTNKRVIKIKHKNHSNLKKLQVHDDKVLKYNFPLWCFLKRDGQLPVTNFNFTLELCWPLSVGKKSRNTYKWIGAKSIVHGIE